MSSVFGDDGVNEHSTAPRAAGMAAATDGAPNGTPSAPQPGPVFDYARLVGGAHGTEDFGLLLYALAKMHRPETILELGTGLGVCALLLAQAVAENGVGHVWTVDDGSMWRETRAMPAVRAAERDLGDFGDDHRTFFPAQAARLGLADRVTLLSNSMPPFPFPERPVDLLFSDFWHDPAGVVQLLTAYLPKMAPAASVFIDSASTHLSAFLLLERLVAQFDAGQVPDQMLRVARAEDRAALEAAVRNRRFTLVHLTERKARQQNSTAWLKIEPVDIVPHPSTEMHI